MIAVVDYGVGNLFSLCSSLRALGVPAQVSGDAAVLQQADKIILPGVGAFGDAMQKLQQTELAAPLRKMAGEGKPLLGICLGMQLLFEQSTEFGTHKGLGLIPGRIAPLQQALQAAGFALKVPHIGWNALRLTQPGSPLLKHTKEADYVYYVHSYWAVECENNTIATSEYGVQVPGAVQCGRVFGTQFHPEKSGDVGLRILRAFAEM